MRGKRSWKEKSLTTTNVRKLYGGVKEKERGNPKTNKIQDSFIHSFVFHILELWEAKTNLKLDA